VAYTEFVGKGRFPKRVTEIAEKIKEEIKEVLSNSKDDDLDYSKIELDSGFIANMTDIRDDKIILYFIHVLIDTGCTAIIISERPNGVLRYVSQGSNEQLYRVSMQYYHCGDIKSEEEESTEGKIVLYDGIYRFPDDVQSVIEEDISEEDKRHIDGVAFMIVAYNLVYYYVHIVIDGACKGLVYALSSSGENDDERIITRVTVQTTLMAFDQKYHQKLIIESAK
jgi:hypothetical protein